MVEVHLTLVIATALLVLYSDEQGLMWVLGKRETLPARRLAVLHAAVGIGLAGIITTGATMFLDRVEYLLSQPIFLTKMAFVFALIVNGFFIGALSKIAATRSFASLSARERVPLYVSGAVSLLGWVGAITCGLLL